MLTRVAKVNMCQNTLNNTFPECKDQDTIIGIEK